MITTDTEVWGQKVNWYREYLSHPTSSDDYWNTGFWGELRKLAKEVRFPSLCMVEGWFDHHLGSALHSYEWLSEAQKAHTQLLVGPWNHSFGLAAPGKNIPESRDLDRWTILADWLDKTLLRDEQPQAGIHFYEMGANKWLSLPSYPYPADRMQLCFSVSADGRKSLSPSPGEGKVSFVYDPRNPVPTCGGEAILTTEPQRGSLLQPLKDYRADVLSFVSELLPCALSVVGAIVVRLRVASTAKDTAFCAKLCEEKADGSAWNIRTMIGSLAYREGSDHRVGYTPGTFVDLELRSWDVAWTLDAGSRIRIDVTSSDFPQYAAHGNSDALWCMIEETAAAEQTLDCTGCTVEIPVKP